MGDTLSFAAPAETDDLEAPGGEGPDVPIDDLGDLTVDEAGLRSPGPAPNGGGGRDVVLADAEAFLVPTEVTVDVLDVMLALRSVRVAGGAVDGVRTRETCWREGVR